MRNYVEGVLPIEAKVEPWVADLLSNHEQVDALLATHGSPLNLINPAPMIANLAELDDVAAQRGVGLRLYFARKANKALALVETAFAQGHGVDVSSERELDQVMAIARAHDIDPERVVLTAAIKPDALIARAVAERVVISIDNRDELDVVTARAGAADGPVPVALRLFPDLPDRPASRFGLTDSEARGLITTDLGQNLRLRGLHVHLDGYDPAERAVMLDRAMALADLATDAGHRVEFIDLGGGLPMRYVEQPDQWRTFLAQHQSAFEEGGDPLTWRDHRIGMTYPVWQPLTRSQWLAQILDAPSDTEPGATLGEAMSRRGLRLHLEPGRTLLDGCGLTIARVEARKTMPDGSTVVGLSMNRTQCRSAADDFLVDPILVPRPDGSRTEPGEGYLVGAYCIENELITWRRLRFPQGVAVGDVLAFVNTAGYLMHIVESTSHQIPLARNLTMTDDGWQLDRIDSAVAR